MLFKNISNIFAKKKAEAEKKRADFNDKVQNINNRADTILNSETCKAEDVIINDKNVSFFMSQKNYEEKEFGEVLQSVQEYISESYSELITDSSLEDSKEQIKRYISKFVEIKKVSVKGYTENQLIDALYAEMAEYGFLTKYIFGKGIEEIDINAWNDIEVQYSDGKNVKLDEHFDSPEHAINVIRRMLHVSGMVLDNATPAVLGSLTKNIRIAALKTPLVDEDVGVAASIRIVNQQNMTKDDFIKSGTATAKMLDFLSSLLRYGISVCISGATSSGKTTVLGWLLTTIPNNKRIYTIENGSRELNLVKSKYGKIINSVVHTITKDSDIESQRVDQIKLLDMALRFNPDIVIIGEMRGPEANAGQEAARTGIAVATTIHANDGVSTHRRMVSLCKRAVDMSDDTLFQYVTEAYPIIAFCKQLENKQRRMMEILECEILPNGERVYHTLFQYVITSNIISDDGQYIIEGHHEQVNGISETLAHRLMENGMPIKEVEKFKLIEEVVA